jgi:hypothetical protein
LESGRQAAGAAGGASWFNNLIKVDDAFFGGGSQLFLTNATISFGGQSFTVPNATISFTSSQPVGAFSPDHSWATPGHGFNAGGFVFGGGAFDRSSNNAASSNAGSSADSHGSNPGFSTQVPGAGGAYNPFNPDLGAGGSGGSTSGNTKTGFSTISLQLLNGTTAHITASGLTLDPASVPATPEPSPLLLLATGLGVFFVWKKWDTLKSTMA